MTKELDRPMKVQQVLLTIAYDPKTYQPPIAWDWHAIINEHRDCQLLQAQSDEPATEPTPAQVQMIMEWDE